MSKFELSDSLPISLPRAVDVARAAVREMGLIVREEGPTHVRASENRLTMNPWANSVTLTITLREENEGLTVVIVKAKNLGLGFVQARHVRKIAESFAARWREAR